MDIQDRYPSVFAIIYTVFLTAVAIIGHKYAGVFIPLITVAVMVVIGFFTVTKKSSPYESVIKELMEPNVEYNNLENDDATDAEGEVGGEDEYMDEDEEFVPETNRTNLAILEKASELTSPTEDIEEDEENSDDIPSELLIPDSIPEINENSTDDDDDDLIPIVDTANKTQHAQCEPLTVASKMHFKKGHFKNDQSLSPSLSSSSSEESLSKGLRFPDHTVVDGGGGTMKRSQQIVDADTSAAAAAATAAATVSNVISNQLPNLIGGLTIKWLTGGGGVASDAPPPPPPATTTTMTASKSKIIEVHSDSSQESEFEFLDNE